MRRGSKVEVVEDWGGVVEIRTVFIFASFFTLTQAMDRICSALYT